MAATPTTGVCSSAFLLFAMLLLVSNCQCANAKACPKDCPGNAAAYMTCPYSGRQMLKPVCNCCLADPGCKLIRRDRTVICTAEEPEPVICPLICYSAAYMTCPSTGTQMLAPACSCCGTNPGCKLYGYDGTVICTAEENSALA